VAGPLRFRRSTEGWDEGRVRDQLWRPLADTIGAALSGPWFAPPEGFEARRLAMDNGDLALFAWRDGEGYWVGNTETPSALWRTRKHAFADVPAPLAAWAERELLATLAERDPWIAEFDHVARFFLPVFLSKDGSESTRAFFREEAAGFPDADPEDGTAFYERFLATGALDDHRYTMAAKLGTSQRPDSARMSATMAEFTVAKLLSDAGLEFVPEVELDSGYALDFAVETGSERVLVEVTRPQPPDSRRAATPAAAVRATGSAKTDGQLDAHPDAVLFVDCTSFRDDEWHPIRAERPGVGHEPAVVFRTRPDGHVEGYRVGTLPVSLSDAPAWVD